ncbi:hypothetical protein A0H81_08552 [Grifola frondosa]|uniref:Uncharacterized protein n=1 Tax=Grifola frondosa TaxID=5627 RepID=A0A1C7M2A4_GRIFR|nr:hypothetical protein A0H81_08552 [Grifola frondosa]
MNELVESKVAHAVNVLKFTIKRFEEAAAEGDMATIRSAQVACASVEAWAMEATLGHPDVLPVTCGAIEEADEEDDNESVVVPTRQSI